jgi:hypothetical protein
MCTYLNGRLIAFTGELPPELMVVPVAKVPKMTRRVRSKASVVVKLIEFNEIRTYQGSCERETFQIPDYFAKRYIRTNGGSYRNAGRKPRRAH